jgi:predicted transcriptional regulator of viral defense system
VLSQKRSRKEVAADALICVDIIPGRPNSIVVSLSAIYIDVIEEGSSKGPDFRPLELPLGFLDQPWPTFNLPKVTNFVTFIESKRMHGRPLLDGLTSKGRYHFSSDEAVHLLGSSAIAARAVLRRLKASGAIATPYRGFHVILPPEYRAVGCLPPEQFVPQLMENIGEPYYVGLLSAAEFHGAAHQRPQQFEVMTPKNRSDIRCGKVHVVFIARRNMRRVPTTSFNTPRGTVNVSIPEATALDLVSYPNQAGGIEQVATVLQELGESMKGPRLAELATWMVDVPVVQRLGYLLERVGHRDLSTPLAKVISKLAARPTALVPSLPSHGSERDNRWRIAINTDLQVDL